MDLRAILIFCIHSISEYLKKALFESFFSEQEILFRQEAVARYLHLKNLFLNPDEVRKERNSIVGFLDANPDSRFCCIEDGVYPEYLKESRYSPFGLFYRGSLENDWARSICLVGTRHPYNFCTQEAFRFGLECGLNGFSVASGLAVGIDQAVMEGCLKGGGKTFGVLGCGLGVDYPSNARYMKENTAKNGAVISQFPPFMPALKYNFPMRNEVLAQLCPALVAFQAPEGSGVMNTVRHALDYGRDVFVHQSAVGPEPQMKGTVQLAADGAAVINSPADVHPGKKPVKVKRIAYSSGLERQYSGLYRFRNAWYIREGNG